MGCVVYLNTFSLSDECFLAGADLLAILIHSGEWEIIVKTQSVAQIEPGSASFCFFVLDLLLLFGDSESRTGGVTPVLCSVRAGQMSYTETSHSQSIFICCNMKILHKTMFFAKKKILTATVRMKDNTAQNDSSPPLTEQGTN